MLIFLYDLKASLIKLCWIFLLMQFKVLCSIYSFKYIRETNIDIQNDTGNFETITIKNKFECFNICSRTHTCDLVTLKYQICKLFNNSAKKKTNNGIYTDVYFKINFNNNRYLKI